MRWHVNGGYGRVDESDVLRLIPLGGPDIPSLQARLRSQVGLGQRGAAERDPWLRTDDHHLPTEALVAESGGGVASGNPAADDHYPFWDVPLRHTNRFCRSGGYPIELGETMVVSLRPSNGPVVVVLDGFLRQSE